MILTVEIRKYTQDTFTNATLSIKTSHGLDEKEPGLPRRKFSDFPSDLYLEFVNFLKAFDVS